MHSFDPVQDLADFARLQDELEALFRLEPAVAARVAPQVSGWSAEQHLAHVALANELVLRNLASLAAGKGVLLVHGAESNPAALAVLAAGTLPRGQAQAPRIVRPPERIDRTLLAQWLADARAALARLDPRALPAGEPKIPHQALGPLDAPQWARFAVVHTRHHLTIAREVLAASG
ncbi:MAG TPA: DinB family protein [Planctomycetota bacterium]